MLWNICGPLLCAVLSSHTMQPRARFNAKARQGRSHKKKAKRGKDTSEVSREEVDPNVPIVVPKTEGQKEELRVKARALLVAKGMPQALSSVMGAAASGEALGKVFDCLQVPSVSRGLIFGLMLQALRVVTQ